MRLNWQSSGFRSDGVGRGVLRAGTGCQYAPFTLSIEPYLSAA
jgi:hypothetical protein